MFSSGIQDSSCSAVHNMQHDSHFSLRKHGHLTSLYISPYLPISTHFPSLSGRSKQLVIHSWARYGQVVWIPSRLNARYPLLHIRSFKQPPSGCDDDLTVRCSVLNSILRQEAAIERVQVQCWAWLRCNVYVIQW